MIINADARHIPLADKSVNCVVTSPPYWGLRDYGVSGQIGLEGTPEQYTESMVQVFREVKRVLRDDGTLWLNLGDSYAGGSGCHAGGSDKQNSNGGATNSFIPTKTGDGLKQKDLIGIPWRVAFALQADGWYLRSDIIWAKPNPMPESVTDRPTKAHEYIFLLSKSARYYYDAEAIKEPCKKSSMDRLGQDVDSQAGSTRANGGQKTNGAMKAVVFGGNKKNGGRTYSGKEWNPTMAGGAIGIEDRKHAPYPGANKRTVWTVSTYSYSGAHFATYPPALIEPCILAGCPVGGIVLDPFFGSGTTGEVATLHNRRFIGLELNPKYIELAKERTSGIPVMLPLEAR